MFIVFGADNNLNHHINTFFVRIIFPFDGEDGFVFAHDNIKHSKLCIFVCW